MIRRKTTIKKFEKKVGTILTRYTEDGFIAYKNCNAVCDRLEDVLEETYTAFLEDSYLSDEPFRKALFVLRTAVKMSAYADSSSGYLTDLMRSSLGTMDLIVDQLRISDERGSSVARNIIEEVEEELQREEYYDFVEFLYALLEIVAPLITTENKAALVAASAALVANHHQPFVTQYHQQFCKALAGIPTEQTVELPSDLTTEAVLASYEQALAAGENHKAVALCRAALTQQIGDPLIWHFKLGLLLHDSNQPELEVIELRAQFQLDSLIFIDEYFDLLERLGYEDERESAFDKLLESLWVEKANELFAKNQKWRHLSENLSRDFSEIKTYAKVLLAHDAAAVYRLYATYLLNEATRCGNRKQYHRLCEELQHFTSLDTSANKAAQIVAADLRVLYRNKPALLEELDGVCV